jgi:acyl carrier protein
MMTIQDPALLTHAELAAAPANERVRLIEAFLLASISALKPGSTETIDASRQLADLGIDSLQVVELKFGLDQVLGQEVDVELIISNPTVGELAANSLHAAGL